MSPRLMLLLSYDMDMNRYAKKLTSPGVQYHYTLLGIIILNLSYFKSLNGVFKASNQTHWKLGVEIWIDQFSS